MSSVPGYLKGGFNPGKYIITKSNGNPVDPAAKYFVLRYDKDRHARKAMFAYAESVARENAQLAADLVVAVNQESES